VKITVNNEVTGCFGLLPNVEVYDSYGSVSGLWIDKAPRQLSAERLAVASALAFRTRLSGHLSLEKAISPATAEAISAFLRPAYVAPTPIEFRPLTLPKGNSEFVVHKPGMEPRSASNSVDGVRSISLDLRRSDRWTGAMMSFDRLVLATNAWLMAEPGNEVESYYSSLAVGVLFAEDFDVDSLFIPDVEEASIPRVLVRLLSAARLGIRGRKPAPLSEVQGESVSVVKF
jgi:hypothetical protein